ncbi:protein of unknown function [Rhodovastum atsumiense]|nr:DUF3280 domain-containing protein [Rhodovastum atsumiense]CAH2605035.1 protein of unknown function [Rhodovastum atsumiense]
MWITASARAGAATNPINAIPVMAVRLPMTLSAVRSGRFIETRMNSHPAAFKGRRTKGSVMDRAGEGKSGERWLALPGVITTLTSLQAQAKPLRTAVFDVEFVDTSLEGEIHGPRPEERERLIRMDAQLRDRRYPRQHQRVLGAGTALPAAQPSACRRLVGAAVTNGRGCQGRVRDPSRLSIAHRAQHSHPSPHDAATVTAPPGRDHGAG